MRTLIFLFAVFSSFTLSAQTVHLVRIADVYGEGIETATENDCRNFLEVMQRNIQTGKLVDHPFDCRNSNRRETILTFLRNLPKVQPGDTLVFYYSGHGMHDENRGQYYPIAFPGIENNDLLKSDILTAMETHRPNLTVVISDCCSVVAKTMKSLPPVNFASTPKGFRGPEKTSPLFRQLFLETKGLVDFQAAQIDEAALALQGGSVMTNVLCTALEEQKGKTMDWKKFFPVVQSGTQTKSKEIERKERAAAKGREKSKKLYHTPKAFALGLSFGVAVADTTGKVVIARLRTDYPAANAGLAVDDVITAIDGRAVRSVKDYEKAIDAHRSSQPVEVKILRKGQAMTFKVSM